MTVLETYEAAASEFAGLVRQIRADQWDGPGLGEWDLRALVGHTSRALTTVTTYLSTTAEHEDLAGPQEYYVQVRAAGSRIDPAAVVERGRQAGTALGDNPAATVESLARDVLDQLDGAEDRLITVIGGLGIRLSAYLPTRTFELAVHSLDIAAAADIAFALPRQVLEEVTLLAARIALAIGDGSTLLTALTGRNTLPEAFSVV